MASENRVHGDPLALFLGIHAIRPPREQFCAPTVGNVFFSNFGFTGGAFERESRTNFGSFFISIIEFAFFANLWFWGGSNKGAGAGWRAAAGSGA